MGLLRAIRYRHLLGIGETSAARLASMAILTPQSATPRCTASVQLISRVFRPFLFEVTVTGEPPHAFVRKYRVAAPCDDSAAMKGLQLFVKEFAPRVMRNEMADLAPRAKLQ
jgi:hypothetical protein